MYSKIFFLIILCTYVLSDDEENEKYIDLLPEEEKQEFLNRIARRILEGIKSNNKPDESQVDITDAQLDAQDAFVKEILKEESENFKNNMRQSDNQEVDDDKALLNTGDIAEIIESQHGPSDDAKADKIVHFQLGNDDKTENNDRNAEFNKRDKKEHVDLSPREGQRQKRKDGDSNIEAEITPEMSYDVIPVKTIYDQQNDNVEIINEPGTMSVNKPIKLKVEQVSNSTNENEGPVSEVGNSSNLILTTNELISNSLNDTDKTDGSENLKDEEIAVSSLGNESNIEVFNNDLLSKSNKITNSENLRKSFDHKLKVGNIKTKDLQPHFQITHDYDINDDTTLFPITYAAEITVRTENDNNWLTTQKIYEKEEQEKTTTLNFNTTNYEVSPTELNEVTISLNNSETIKNYSGTSEIINVTNSNAYEPLEKLENTKKYSEFNNYSPKNSSTSFEDHKELVKRKTKRYSALENHSGEVHEVTNGPKKQLNNENIFRARLNDDLSQIDEYEPFQKAEDSKNAKVYEVYEVDSAKPNFISTGEEKQKEPPLYVPVYNYAPENAYFKPYNKFGPNVEDMKKQDIPESLKQEYSPKILPNTRNRFSSYGYNKKESTYDKKTYETNSNKNKKGKSVTDDFVKTLKEKLINHNIYFNAQDYADLVYYNGRILRRDDRRGNKYNKNSQIHKEIESRSESSNEKLILDTNDADSHKSEKIKDHLRALRKISYLKNQFGFVPKANENVVRKPNIYSETAHKLKKDSIAMDYYFGRADSDEITKDMSNSVYRLKYKSRNKKTNSDLSPLTPNPLNFQDDEENLPKKTLFMNRDSYSITQEISDVPFKTLFEALLVVLRDSLQVENEDLVKYDWLKTTVNIQAAMRKLLDLIEQLKYGEYIHPKDLELMKYMIYIFESSKTTLEREKKNRDLSKMKSIELQRANKKNTVPKMPKSKKITKIKEPIKLWKNFATFLRIVEIETEGTNYKLLNDLEDFLRELMLNLHDLHNAIKHIAIITEYNNQNWFKDLKDIYLGKGNNKNLAQVILHLSLSKLLDSIEDSSVHGVEDNFRNFVKKNREDVEKSKEECLFVLKILEELKRMERVKYMI